MVFEQRGGFMSKGLEAFIIPTMNGLEKVVRYADIEKELKDKEKKDKFVEIIKRNRIVGFDLGWDGHKWIITISSSYDEDDIIIIAEGYGKEEYELLKEVLL